MGATGGSLEDVVARLRGINDALPSDDGAAVFNGMYLTVTEQVAAALTGAKVFRNPAFMAHLDATFAALLVRGVRRAK